MMVTLMVMAMISLTPVKMCIMLCVMSLAMSMEIYHATNSVFYSSSMVLSFSSGMMILLTYSATNMSQESYNPKPMKTTMMLITMSTPLAIMMETNHHNMYTMASLTINSMTMIVLMCFLILCMKTMNKIMTEKSMSMKKSL